MLGEGRIRCANEKIKSVKHSIKLLPDEIFLQFVNHILIMMRVVEEKTIGEQLFRVYDRLSVKTLLQIRIENSVCTFSRIVVSSIAMNG